MTGLMVMPILDDIDDTQHDIVPFDSSAVVGLSRLLPPNIPGQFVYIDYPPAQVGVNRAMLHTSAKGLRVLVQAYLNMDEDDTIRLYDDDVPVDTAMLPADHGNRDVLMHIAANKVRAGVRTLRYEILRKSGQPPEGAQLEVWFKIDTPGGIDPEPDVPGNQRLKPPRLQLAPGQVIDKDVAANGFWASIPHWPVMTKGDKLKLFFHGIAVTPRTVLESEVGKDISVFISPENIGDAGPADPAVVVYQIQDQVEQVSDFSERTTVVSDPGNDWLDPVIVPLANDDQVSLDQVGFEDLEVQIITRPGFALKEKLLLRWVATTQSGEVIEHSEEQTITRIGIQSFKVPSPIVLASAPAQVQVDYLRTKADGNQDRSEIYIFTLLGTTLRLPAPWITDLVGGTLDPALSRTVVLCGPDVRIKKGFRVTLTWMGTSASGRPHLYQTYRDVSDQLVGQAIAFNVTAKDIAPLNRGSVRVSYEVSHATLNPVLVSEALNARVDDFKPVLPAPRVIGSSDGVLNPEHVPYGTDIQVAAASYTCLGDVVHVEGRGDAGGLVFRDKLPIEHTRVGKDLEFWLDGEAIESYREQFFSLLWWIERPEELPQSSSALELFIGDPSLSLQAPRVWRAPRGILNPLENIKGAVAWVHLANPRPGTQVLLKVKGAAGAGSPVFVPQSLDADNRAGFTLSPEFIAENLGGKVLIDYDVLGGVRPITSPTLELTVLRIADQDAGLVKPVIVEAGGTQFIDLRTISRDLTCSIPSPLPIAVVGRKVWIEISDSKGSALRVRDGVALNDEEISKGITAKVDLKWFAALDDLSQCKLTCRIALGSTDTEATALILPVASYTVKVTPALAIDTSRMVLNGLKLIDGAKYGLREREVPFNTELRWPVGGLEPFTFTPADSSIVSVDRRGKTVGLRNGSTTVSVADATGRVVSYPVTVFRVHRLLLNDTRMTAKQAMAWFDTVGAAKIDNSGQPLGWDIIRNNFFDSLPIYGAPDIYYGRFVSQNLTYPGVYVLANAHNGSWNVFQTDPATYRAMAYIPT